MADREDGLGVAAVEQRERVLHPLVAHEPFQLRDLEGLGELLAVEVRRADGADFARADELVERAQRLLLRHIRIEVVRHVERDALDPESLRGSCRSGGGSAPATRP